MEQAIGMMDALHLAEATHAGVERRHLGRPLPGIGADLDDAAVADVGIDHAAAAAIVATRAGDDGLAGLGGWTPRPRKDRNDSRMITRATCSVAMTTISDTRFGRIWRKMMRGWLIPSARPAMMNSRSRIARVSARTTRA